METDSGLELENRDRFRPGTWKWRPIPAWNLEMEISEYFKGREILTWNLELETDSGLELGNGDQ
ncbi:hypothetical protein RhiirA5_412615 [Rhizophagus irregularis]|uniref:Uncharacterized protein n=1 Tax=Rhizophagus irregularis TaxID=588596 RepID=A0A2N0PY94_9GLOM|nr:hypothetical protein RhiirA5_412615 [Rhizophagus irregularis]